MATSLLSQQIPISVANKRGGQGCGAPPGFTLETFTSSSCDMAVSPSMWIPSGCEAHRMGREEDLPPLFFFRFWLYLTRNQSRLKTLTLAKSHQSQQ